MPTIAELTVKIDSRPIDEGTQALKEFASAAQNAKTATDKLGGTGGSTTVVPAGEAQKVKDLSSAIDSQTRKLKQLSDQRKDLESSGMKSTAPQEYERLNRIIDANISLVNRQGNSIELLDEKRHRASQKMEASSAAELRAQERIADAAQRQENIVSTASAKQQREIEQTISGLSRQIKAQTEYNATIERLNLARVQGSGTDGMKGSSGIGAGEYDSYVKLAQAKRDAAFATEDNSRQLLAAQSRLETYTATLGKVERAEVRYARAVRILDDNLEKGNITMDQYNQKLSAFAAHRDKAIDAANSNANAEARFERQLQSVVSAYDPLLKAQDRYNASVKILDEGLDKGIISQREYTKALHEQAVALDEVRNSPTGADKVTNDYNSALRAVLPYRTELENLEKAQRQLDAGKNAGNVQSKQQIEDYDNATAAIRRQREEYTKRIREGDKAGISFKQEQAAMRGLPAQFTDIVVSLQGGQAPLTVLLQQGGQIKDMFGGIGPALSAMARGLIAMINPLSVVGTALAVVAYNAYQGSQELNAFNKAVAQSGGFSGASASEFTQYGAAIEKTGINASSAAEAITAMTATGKIAEENFVNVAVAANAMKKATGQSIQDTVDEFASLAKDPVNAVVRLDEKYKFLTSSILTQIQALEDQGKTMEAAALAQDAMAKGAKDMADNMVENLGWAEKAWNGLKSAISATGSAIAALGRDSTNQAVLSSLEEGLAKSEKSLREGNLFTGPQTEDQIAKNGAIILAKERIKQMKMVIDIENLEAERKQEAERKRQESVTATAKVLNDYERTLSGVKKAENELEKVQINNAKVRSGGGNVSPELNAKLIAVEAEATKKLAEAKEKAARPGRAGALDTTGVQEVKSNLTAINAEYDGYYKRVTALGESSLVSAEATYQSQRSILEAQRKAVSSSYDDQISAINNLKENKKNSAAQNISLDNQLTKAEAAKAKAMEDIDTRLDVLQTKENGRIQERTRNVVAYKAALDAQLDSMREAGARNADGVGRGQRQAGVNQQLGDADRNFNKAQLALANALAAKDIDNVEYDEKLKDLELAHNDMTKQIIKNDADIQAANLDWTNGFTSAVEDARDAGLNFAGSMNAALTGAFNSAGQALGDFVTTGKLNFKDFASSVIQDMARIAAQQAASGLLSSLLSFGAQAAGMYFGGGNGLSGAGGASSNLGASQAGYNNLSGFSVAQAKGGAWSGGTQYFANGGTFTNSVVSNPTSFGMSNGAKGVMGEAGPEAIVPLARTRNGDLGVRMMGEGGGGNTTVVNVTVNVAEGGNSTSTDGGAGYDNMGQKIGQVVRQEIYSVINKETRPGGSIQPQK